MMVIPFTQFKKDFAYEYDIKKGDYIRIENRCDMDEVIWVLYEVENYEINYEDNTIELC